MDDLGRSGIGLLCALILVEAAAGTVPDQIMRRRLITEPLQAVFDDCLAVVESAAEISGGIDPPKTGAVRGECIFGTTVRINDTFAESACRRGLSRIVGAVNDLDRNDCPETAGCLKLILLFDNVTVAADVFFSRKHIEYEVISYNRILFRRKLPESIDEAREIAREITGHSELVSFDIFFPQDLR